MRIQILELPSKVVGEVVETPFALVLDEVDGEQVTTLDGQVVRESAGPFTSEKVATIAEAVGAVTTLVFRETVEVVR